MYLTKQRVVLCYQNYANYEPGLKPLINKQLKTAHLPILWSGHLRVHAKVMEPILMMAIKRYKQKMKEKLSILPRT